MNIKDTYLESLRKFDHATCEAYAVSQAAANIKASPTVGYSTHVFTRMCSHAVSIMRACPKSRWSRSDFEHWDISAVPVM